MKFEEYIINEELREFRVSSEESSLEQTLYRVLENSIKDRLTGCFNRVKFENILEYFRKEYLENGYSGCIALIDIDFFKHINDDFGHSCGDYVLKILGQELRKFYCQFFQVEEPLIIRWGGEEFLFFVPFLESVDPKYFGMMLKNLVRNTEFNFKGLKISVKISGGLALLNDPGKILEAIDQADSALYYSKQSGRDRISKFSDIELKCTVTRLISQKLLIVSSNFPVEIDSTMKFEFYDRARKDGLNDLLSKGTGRLVQPIEETGELLFELMEFDSRWDIHEEDYFLFKPEKDFREHFLFRYLQEMLGKDVVLLYHHGDCRIFPDYFRKITGKYYYSSRIEDSESRYRELGFHYFKFRNFNEQHLFYYIAVTRYQFWKLADVNDITPENAENLLRLLFDRKDWDFLESGILEFEKLIDVDLIKGIRSAISGNYQQALEYFKNVPVSDEVLGNKAGCLIRLEKYDEAEECLEQALQITSDDWRNKIYEHLFFLYFKRKDIGGMERTLSGLITPLQRGKALLNISDYYLETGVAEKMEHHLRQASRIAPFHIHRVFEKSAGKSDQGRI